MSKIYEKVTCSNKTFIFHMANHMNPTYQPETQLNTIIHWILNTEDQTKMVFQQQWFWARVQVDPQHPLFCLLDQVSQQKNKNWLIYKTTISQYSADIFVTHFGPFGLYTNSVLENLYQQEENIHFRLFAFFSLIVFSLLFTISLHVYAKNIFSLFLSLLLFLVKIIELILRFLTIVLFT